ncbi:MAG: cytochrome P450 [Rhodobacterales bacterium]|nr:cytochrome P450 [Rhodobacterales bacterium]
MPKTLPPKPTPRPKKVSLWRYAKLFREDILSAQPARLYHAWMAEFRTPFFRSFMINQPELIKTVLKERPDDFPKSNRIKEGLAPLLGESVFVTNGAVWKHQRRIIDPAFEGGRLREVYPAMWDAAVASVARVQGQIGSGPVEMEGVTSHVAADVIFRTLFSIPIDHEVAGAVFSTFKDYQRTQPILNLAAFLPMPKWMPRFRKRETKDSAAAIRALITQLTKERAAAIAAGTAPDDLATKIMTTPDPETGKCFDTQEMVDQVAIFFLAGHETSASALGWALYLLAMYPESQSRVAQEATEYIDPEKPYFSSVSKLTFTRDVFREAMRLYPPVPMMVRENTCPERFRDRDVPKGSQIVLSPWHLHRHERLWDRPDEFDPERFQTKAGKASMRAAYIPFSAGSRVCPGSGFAMIEGPLILAMLVRAFRFDLVAERPAVPVAHLTVRSKDGIWLTVTPR